MKTFNETTAFGPVSILLIGPPGQGKTTFVIQWPGAWIANIDNNLDGPVRFLRSKGLKPTFSYDNIFEDDNGNRIEPKFWFPQLVKLTDAVVKNPAVSTIIIDGMTQLDHALTAYVLMKQGVASGVMELQHWRPWRAYLYNYISMVRNSGKTFILTCHEEYIRGKDGNSIIRINPTVSTGLRDYLSGLFTDCWRCTLRPDGGGKVTAKVRTISDAVIDLKNSLVLPTEIDANYETIRKALGK